MGGWHCAVANEDTVRPAAAVAVAAAAPRQRRERIELNMLRMA